jgi:hypothetical protein
MRGQGERTGRKNIARSGFCAVAFIFSLSPFVSHCALAADCKVIDPISIASNIAEGAARQGDKEFIQYLHIALGSAAELETQLIIAGEVKLGSAANLKGWIEI